MATSTRCSSERVHADYTKKQKKKNRLLEKSKNLVHDDRASVAVSNASSVF
ncbi:hypothetical protein WH47_09345 [Habropoda laboriosa]|uniref:Uncharacterized protein n=1 Tax=Habropoda laboriosa TaxID=597456 RepID=A0A0L7REL0_9HYME|nr:hypothetical protein WH47_09345 [Habropoda laboriosa]